MTDQDIASLIQEFNPPLHVQRHCNAVANFAVEIGQKLVASGEKVNLTLLKQAALLHDLLRVVDFREFHPEKFHDRVTKQDIFQWQAQREKFKGLGHEEAAARVLEERGFYEVANLVRKHRFLQIQEGFNTWEEKLLYYADKRTKHDHTVSLAERLKDGRKRNAPETIGSESSRELDKKVFALEREILSKITKA